VCQCFGFHHNPKLHFHWFLYCNKSPLTIALIFAKKLIFQPFVFI
jgi:hypothetical protein